MWDARNYIYKQDFSTNNSFDLRQNKIKTVLSKIINIVPNESVSNIWKINLILKFIIPARW
jgi:hypothetical protein